MLQKSSISKTLEIFFLNPSKEHYLMNISRNIELAHTSVKKNIVKLVKLELIKEIIEEKRKIVAGERETQFDIERTSFKE